MASSRVSSSRLSSRMSSSRMSSSRMRAGDCGGDYLARLERRSTERRCLLPVVSSLVLESGCEGGEDGACWTFGGDGDVFAFAGVGRLCAILRRSRCPLGCRDLSDQVARLRLSRIVCALSMSRSVGCTLAVAFVACARFSWFSATVFIPPRFRTAAVKLGTRFAPRSPRNGCDT